MTGDPAHHAGIFVMHNAFEFLVAKQIIFRRRSTQAVL